MRLCLEIMKFSSISRKRRHFFDPIRTLDLAHPQCDALIYVLYKGLVTNDALFLSCSVQAPLWVSCTKKHTGLRWELVRLCRRALL